MKTAASRRAFFAACFLGALYLFAMSPLAIPDEEYHYRVSYCLSNYLLGQWNDPLSGAERYFDFALLQGHYNTAAGSARLWKEFWSAGPPGGTMVVLDALPRVVELLGTWDITTIRASIGMYLVCKWIHEHTDIRVLLTGEISDELFGYTSSVIQMCHNQSISGSISVSEPERAPLS